ncbi:MAG: hypothetical protein AABW81_01225 [Nanoarchaeota archaeon]
MQLSKLEDLAYRELTGNNLLIFKIKELCLLLGISKVKAYNLLKSLKKKQIVKKIGKGFFAVKGADDFVIATSIYFPSYISFWSALSYYKFSDNLVQKIFLATSKYTKDIGNFKYVTLSKQRFFGYISIGKITIAEKEKAIVDSLLFPRYSGGIKEIIKCMKNGMDELDIEKVIEYSIKVKSKAVLKRLGFILEKIGYTGRGIKKIQNKIGRGYSLLDPGLNRRNNLNKRWLLDINY